MRLLLLPFSWIYGVVVSIRNLLFDLNWLKQESFPVPVVTIGNLSAGGTGKSPLVLKLAEELSARYEVAILSRGYGRTTRGFILLDEQANASTVGDEPMQYTRMLKGVMVAVCEKRADGIRALLKMNPSVQLILLDDAFQHRYVKPGFSILLTEYSRPYFQDHLLPAGMLREPVSGAKRADAIVVTKCPREMNPAETESMKMQIHPLPAQHLFFSYIQYRELHSFSKGPEMNLAALHGKKVLLVCGIARPEPLRDYLQSMGAVIEEMFFADHHLFTSGDALSMVKRFEQSAAEIVITTRKDAMRLEAKELRQHLDRMPLYIMDISPEFSGAGKNLSGLISDFVTGFRK